MRPLILNMHELIYRSHSQKPPLRRSSIGPICRTLSVQTNQTDQGNPHSIEGKRLRKRPWTLEKVERASWNGVESTLHHPLVYSMKDGLKWHETRDTSWIFKSVGHSSWNGDESSLLHPLVSSMRVGLEWLDTRETTLDSQ